jgi:hypothetical protein
VTELPLKPSTERHLDELKRLSRGINTEMTPEAIRERLQIMSDLSRACMELGRAKPAGKVNITTT